MLVQRYLLEVDGRAVDATNARIDSIVSELVLRQEENPGLSFLGTFTQNDVLRRFHDYTGTSIGLLADTVRGGLREDLSDIHLVNTGDTGVDDLVNNYLMPYLNVADIAFTSPTELTRSYPIAAGTTFGGGGPTPNISPVISEFHLVIRMSAKDLETAPEPPPIASTVTRIQRLRGMFLRRCSFSNTRVGTIPFRIRRSKAQSRICWATILTLLSKTTFRCLDCRVRNSSLLAHCKWRNSHRD